MVLPMIEFWLIIRIQIIWFIIFNIWIELWTKKIFFHINLNYYKKTFDSYNQTFDSNYIEWTVLNWAKIKIRKKEIEIKLITSLPKLSWI